MAMYKGKVKKSDLVGLLVDKLTTAPVGSGETYWKAVQSGKVDTEGYVLFSKGKSGKDKIFIRIKDDMTNGRIFMSMMEDYQPNNVVGLAGTAINESYQQHVSYYNSTYASTMPVIYLLNFDRDKIMLVLRGDPGYSTSFPGYVLAWIGMPERLSNEPDSTAVSFAVSRYAYQLTAAGSSAGGAYATLKTLRNRRRLTQQNYSMTYIPNPRTKGAGGIISTSPIYLRDGQEGGRSKLAGVLPIFQSTTLPDFKNGDEITIDSKRYVIYEVGQISGASSDVNCFPSPYMAIEYLT